MRILLLLVMLLPAPLAAQTTEAEVKARLIDKPLYLRGLWQADTLQFDAAGKLKGNSATVPFTCAGVQITRVRVNARGLLLDGTRVGLTFQRGGDRTRVPLVVPERVVQRKPEELHMEIAPPASGDFGPALDVVFADLPELVRTMDAGWRDYAGQHFATSPVAAQPADPALRPVGGRVSRPGIETTVPVKYTSYASVNHVSGTVTVSMTVDVKGRPQDIQIVQPVGMGLDEKALEAVAQYRFTPAKEAGTAVPVRMSFTVPFTFKAQ